MELLEFKDRFLRMLETDKVEEVPEILNRSSPNLIERYQEEFGTDRDWIREFYQYYLADREGLKQDYTPPSLSKLLLHLVGPCRTLVDLCAGTGSLSLYADPDTKIKAIELLKPQPLGVVMDCINWIIDYNSMGNDDVREIMIDVIHSNRRTTRICFADVVPDITVKGEAKRNDHC